MEFAMPRPSGALHLLGAVSRDAWRGLRRTARPSALVASRYALVKCLDDLSTVADRFTEDVTQSEDGQPRANAASVCRWQLARLRTQLEEIEPDVLDRKNKAVMLRHLKEAMSSAQILSAGYRFHSLDRICQGGQSLDDHFEALAKLRVKLIATP
ncbi:MAG: hypothetical protein EXR58_05895 [Chloroflexi bacterium]|nr:hypothetical protein [Chloroflexota bacterium]